MALLKKIRGSTLLETLVASSIILIVFVVGSMILSNLVLSSVKTDQKEQLQVHLNQLEYMALHEQLLLPYFEQSPHWEIYIQETDDGCRLESTLLSNNQTFSYELVK